MSWPWGYGGHGLGFGLDGAGLVNITGLTIASAVWIQYTNVTDGRTQGDRKDRRLYLRIASRGKKNYANGILKLQRIVTLWQTVSWRWCNPINVYVIGAAVLKSSDCWIVVMWISNDNKFVLFLPRDAMRKRGLCCRPVSICLSVTLVHCIHTDDDIVKLFCRLGSSIILVFWPQ